MGQYINADGMQDAYQTDEGEGVEGLGALGARIIGIRTTGLSETRQGLQAAIRHAQAIQSANEQTYVRAARAYRERQSPARARFRASSLAEMRAWQAIVGQLHAAQRSIAATAAVARLDLRPRRAHHRGAR